VKRRRELQRKIESEDGIAFALKWAEAMIRQGLPAGPVSIYLGRPRRTLDQNAKLWPMLTDVSKQVTWYDVKLLPEEWKDVFTAALKKQRAIPGIDGGFVVLGAHTSVMNKRDLAELIELIYAFGAERGVVWTEPKKEEAA
jgi:hypothetical protein